MARPQAEAPPAEAIRALVDGEGRLPVRVTPGARTQGLSIENGRLHAKVRAKPQDGAANAAVVELAAKALGLPKSKVEVLRGATSREKVLRVSPG